MKLETNHQRNRKRVVIYPWYKLISRFLFRFKHHSRNLSVLLGKDIDQGPFKE